MAYLDQVGVDIQEQYGLRRGIGAIYKGKIEILLR